MTNDLGKVSLTADLKSHCEVGKSCGEIDNYWFELSRKTSYADYDCRDMSNIYKSGAAKSIVRIAQVVPQPVRTSGNFQEFTI